MKKLKTKQEYKDRIASKRRERNACENVIQIAYQEITTHKSDLETINQEIEQLETFYDEFQE